MIEVKMLSQQYFLSLVPAEAKSFIDRGRYSKQCRSHTKSCTFIRKKVIFTRIEELHTDDGSNFQATTEPNIINRVQSLLRQQNIMLLR